LLIYQALFAYCNRWRDLEISCWIGYFYKILEVVGEATPKLQCLSIYVKGEDLPTEKTWRHKRDGVFSLAEAPDLHTIELFMSPSVWLYEYLIPTIDCTDFSSSTRKLSLDGCLLRYDPLLQGYLGAPASNICDLTITAQDHMCLDTLAEFIYSVSSTLTSLNVTFRILDEEPKKRRQNRITFQQLVKLELSGWIFYGANLYDGMHVPSLTTLAFNVAHAKRGDYEEVSSMLQASIPPLRTISVQSEDYFEINYDDAIPLWPTLTHLTIKATDIPEQVLDDLTSTESDGTGELTKFKFCSNLEVLELARPGKIIALDKVMDFIVARRPLRNTRGGYETDGNEPGKTETSSVPGYLQRMHVSLLGRQTKGKTELMELSEMKERIQGGLELSLCVNFWCKKCEFPNFNFGGYTSR
jgi:hypothetical protein